MAVRSAARLSLWLLLLSCTRAIVHHRLPLGAHRGSLPSLYRASQPPRCAADFDATPRKETVAARCVAERLQKIRAAGRLPRRPYGLPQPLRYLWPREGAWVAKAMRQAGTAAGGMARAAARVVWTMFGGGHVEEAAEQSGTRTGDHGEPGEAAVGDG